MRFTPSMTAFQDNRLGPRPTPITIRPPGRNTRCISGSATSGWWNWQQGIKRKDHIEGAVGKLEPLRIHLAKAHGVAYAAAPGLSAGLLEHARRVTRPKPAVKSQE